MVDCATLIHPFQNDPGISQRQRIMDDLLAGSAKIDGRTMADLLDYFVQLSRHVNYYDSNLNISDWQPFFQKSIPFSLAAIIKYDRLTLSEKLAVYNKLFDRKPSRSGLQLLVHYMFWQIINRINSWHLQVKGSGLQTETILEKLIRDKLRVPLAKFICYHNLAVGLHCIKPLDFYSLSQNDVWSLNLNKIESKCTLKGKTKRERLVDLRNQIHSLAQTFLDSIRIVADVASQNMDQSLFPLKEELQKNHTPHLALLFTFLKLFQHLQGDLNTYTKKHLDFFYKEVLKLKAREAVPDKVHVVFEIQKQLDVYLLKKGLLLKDGKDNNKAEILFGLDDEIVVNKTQVAEIRTLFLNNQDISEKVYVEGVYMAPKADKADGLQEDFTDETLKSFPTLGAKYSKYKHPEKTEVSSYPNARLGFILASPVLLLNEGVRTVDIILACSLKEDFCIEMELNGASIRSNCCDENSTQVIDEEKRKYPDLIDASAFYSDVEAALKQTYYYINEDLIREVVKKGISKTLEKELKNLLIEILTKNNSDTVCYCPIEIKKYETLLNQEEWEAFYNIKSSDEKAILDQLIKPRTALKISFSGEEQWIEPKFESTPAITISPVPIDINKFLLKITAKLEANQPAVTFYNKDKLKEDFNTTEPVVKIELDDKIKLRFTTAELEERIESEGPQDNCCLLIETLGKRHEISLYHFFRNVNILDNVDNNKLNATRIDVKVCGLKKFIVQNDESVQDVNGLMYPFGTRPVIDTNFYIGSPEIFSKNWQHIQVNHNWKDLPSGAGTNGFETYYTAYAHMFIDPNDITNKTIEGIIKDNNFKASFAVLHDGKWHDNGIFACDPSGADTGNLLFQGIGVGPNLCEEDPKFDFAFKLERGDFSTLPGYSKNPYCKNIKRLNADTRSCFLKVTLKCQDFQHDRYAFILSRQMMAFGRLPADLVAGAYYRVNPANAIIVFNDIGTLAGDLKLDITNLQTSAGSTKTETGQTLADAQGVGGTGAGTPVEANALQADGAAQDTVTKAQDVKDSFDQLALNIPFLDFLLPPNRSKLEAVIPNEPWTPIIKNISIDYTATAAIKDIEMIHLYPYESTYKKEELTLQPMLLPTFCEEGNLFLGLKDLVPGTNVNILFQMAEATADSEADREEVYWHYLDNNQWKSLRNGFEILDDATDGLTTSGIVRFAIPANITKENTILPKGLHWIRAAIPKSSKTVSEIIAVYTQAMRATFTNDALNDKLRLSQPLEKRSVSRLQEADANIKKLTQPFNSFGGRIPEMEGHFYVRVSELLRHKGRAIQKFDYERLALELFPQLFKVKCINHSFGLNANKYKNDFPVAPGYVLLAVIPDLNQLKAVQSFEPRVPVSLLDDLQEQLKKITSPFVRFRAMNPRYEKIHFCLTVQFVVGKDVNYYKEKMKQDLREFLAPWAIGEYEKLTFGQCVSRSEIIQFLETRDYVDYILELLMRHNDDAWPVKTNEEQVSRPICPKTPRSILIAGEIDVCIPERKCATWGDGKNAQGQLVDYCENKRTPIADYCRENILG